MKKIVSLFMAVAVVFGAGLSHSEAAETKPIAALAVTSYNDLVSDVNFLGSLVERPQLGAGLEGLLAMFTQGKGLDGIDKTRTWGLIVQASDEKNVSGYVFVPVTEFKKVLGLLRLYSTVDSEGDVYKLTPMNGRKVGYVKQQGDWAFFAEKPEMLAQCDANPVALLGKLKKEYIVAGRIFLANLPEGLREKFLSQVRQGLQKDAAQHGDESNEAYASRKKIIDQVAPYITRVFSELDQVLFGWGLDRTAEKTFVDVSLSAKPGTETAKEMGMAAKATTSFAGFRLPGAAITYASAGTMPAAKQEIAASVIEALRGKGLSEIEKKTPENQRAVAKELFNDGADLLQKIVKSGHADGAATVLVGPNAATGLLAGYVADGALLDKILHTIDKAIVEDHPELGQFVQLDAETLGAVHFHTISIPIPTDSEEAQKVVQLIGEKLEIVIGVGKKNAYLAVGRDAMATLKKAIEASSQLGLKAVPPLEISIAVQRVAAVAAVIGKQQDRPQAAMHDRIRAEIESELKKTPGKDHIVLAVRPIANGVQVHLEVEQGLVRLFGRLAIMGMEHKTAAPAIQE
ncbi:MAG: hypothetical protein ACLP9L_35725 [Thermoguttaceae bacterium]